MSTDLLYVTGADTVLRILKLAQLFAMFSLLWTFETDSLSTYFGCMQVSLVKEITSIVS